MNKLKYTLRLIILILLSTIISIFMARKGIGKESIIMVFLVGVLTVTVVTSGYIYGVVGSIGSVLLFNYLFTAPVHTFYIYNPSDVTLLLFFFTASLISSSLTNKFQNQLIIAQNNEHTARMLYEITNDFQNITGKKNIVMKGINYIFDHTGYYSYVTLVDSEESYSNTDGQNVKVNIFDFEISGIKKKLGQIKIFCNDKTLNLEQELLIKMVANQIGNALDRELIYNERENIRIQMEREHLRSNLLREISHDLRTPLTGIVGASGLIIEDINTLNSSTIKRLVSDINEEALWLNNLVENILNMTRIGEGKLIIQKQDEVVDDIITEALRHMSSLAKKRNIMVSMPEDVVAVPVDGKLIVQVLINILDNAIKHTTEENNIYLRVFTQEKNVVFEIENNGEEIDSRIKDNLFDNFVTTSSHVVDGKKGMGLGLSICKAIVKAHGGEIMAERGQVGGALFRFTIPLEEVENEE